MITNEPVSRELLEELARSIPQPPGPAGGNASKAAFDMPAFIAQHPEQIKAGPAVPYRGGLKWPLAECPHNPGHLNSSALFLNAKGTPGFKCQHDSCSQKHWRDVLALVEPDAIQAGFRLGSDALWFDNPTADEPAQRICGPLEVVACTRDNESENWGWELHWRDPDGCEHWGTVSASMLIAEGAAYQEALQDGGLNITPGRRARALLSSYIHTADPAARVRSVARTGWCGDSWVLPDDVVGPAGAEKIRYQVPHNTEHYYRIAGTFEAWRTNVSMKCIGNSRLIYAASQPYAAALLTPLDIEGGGTHLVRDTSIGKTTTAIVAGSAIGGGGPRGFARTWRATANAVEIIAEQHNDCFLLLDEIAELADLKEAEPVIYMLSNGEGKARMTRAITARRSLRWRLLFLSSGEQPLSEVAATGGRRIKGGAEVRLINIPADAGAGMGLFENTHGANSPAEFAEQITAAAKQHYGHAFRAFLRQLTADRERWLEKARGIIAAFIEEFLPGKAAPEVRRGLRRFAVTAAGGELATAMGITGWPEGTAKAATAKCFQAWLKFRGGAGAFDADQAVAQAALFIAAHGRSRFQPTTPQYDSRGNPIADRVINRAGFWRENPRGEREYLVFPEVFQQEVCRGYDYLAVAAELARRRHLRHNPRRRTLFAKNMPEGNHFFCILSSILTWKSHEPRLAPRKHR
jgi:uncharacterized protein (DUF927 family)